MGQWAVELLTHGLSAGITLAELHRQVRRCFDTATVSAACVECNFDQIDTRVGKLAGLNGSNEALAPR